MSAERLTFKVTVPHAAACRGFGWFFPAGWRGIGPTERRDRAGRLAGKRRGHYLPDWFVLACNDAHCNGRAVVPVSLVIDHADAADPSVRRHEAAS